MRSPVRVLVVDDSALMRKLIPQLLQGDSSIEVVGTAMDGLLGLKKIGELRPDVVTLDLEMPRMDGLDMLREIVKQYAIPVIVVSSHTSKGAYSALNALSQGAFDFVAKPTDSPKGGLEQIARELAVKIKVAAISGPPKQTFQPPHHAPPAPKPQITENRPTRVVAIGVSTGGPNALDYLCSQLPADFAGCLLIVQHMPERFTGMFARRLNDCSPIHVSEALSGERAREVVRELRDRYPERVVLFDLPPVLGADDALAFLPLVECGLVVVSEGGTRRDDLLRCMELIRNTPIVGTVLNRTSTVAPVYD